MRTTTPRSYNTSGVTSSTFDLWHTAYSRRSAFSAASIASIVPGRPALMGSATPGKTTVSRMGKTGSVIRFAIQPSISHFKYAPMRRKKTISFITERVDRATPSD
jgi:hypothetical protein